MSNRKTLIDALLCLTSASVAELADATDWPERKVRDTLGDCKTTGLVSFERDDVTGKALYRLTKAGAAWQPPKSGRPKKNAFDTPAGGGDVSPAPRDPVPSHDSPQWARGVVELPKPEPIPAEACSDVTAKHYTPDLMVRDLFVHELKNPPFTPPAVKESLTARGAEAPQRQRSLVCTVSSDVEINIGHRGKYPVTITFAEAHELFAFLDDAMAIWGRAAA